MLGHMNMENLPAGVMDNEEHVQRTERDRSDAEEVARPDLRAMCLRNDRQREDGPRRWVRCIYLATVLAETLNPSLASSAWILRSSIPPAHRAPTEIESSESHQKGGHGEVREHVTLYFAAASAMTPDPGFPPSLSHSAGSFRRHRTPSGAKTRSTVPPNSYGIRSRIVLVP